MEKLETDLDDGVPIHDEKQINPEKARMISMSLTYVDHAYQCREENCRFPDCQNIRRLFQHAKRCKLRLKGGCRICRKVLALCCLHVKYCHVANCPNVYCSSIKQHRQQHARILKRCIATIIPKVSADVLQTSPGNFNSFYQPSPGAQPHSSFQPGISMKPSTGPPVGALQAVQPVQAAAPGQTDLHMVAASVNYEKGSPVVSPPIPSMDNGSMAAIQQMEAQMQKRDMRNVACWEGSGYAQNPQSRQNYKTQPNSQLGLKKYALFMKYRNNLSDSIGNSAMRPPKVMPNSGP